VVGSKAVVAAGRAGGEHHLGTLAVALVEAEVGQELGDGTQAEAGSGTGPLAVGGWDSGGRDKSRVAEGVELLIIAGVLVLLDLLLTTVE
jgi:hypothetical protein